MPGFIVKNNIESKITDNPLAMNNVVLHVTEGDGVKFPSIFPFLLTLWDIAEYPDPTNDLHMEIVRCTGRTGDALNIIRAQEDTFAVKHLAGSHVAMLITAGIFNDSVHGVQVQLDNKPNRASSNDNEIVRFHGSQGNLQGYTSKAPTITDDGLMTLKNVLHFEGDARPVKFHIIDSRRCEPACHNPLALTSLAETNGITTDGLDTGASNTRRIKVIGVNGGVHVKGILKATYAREDTTNESIIIKIKLSTTNNTWTQAGEWRVTLDIATGPYLTGKFTCFMPAFSLMEYSFIEGYVTREGSTYLCLIHSGFDCSLAGPSAATENFSNNESAGSDVVIEVADTTGFYEGNKAFVSDSENSEWVRIKTIDAGVSITVHDLLNSYTTANGAKIELFDFTRTAYTYPAQRGILKSYVFKSNINSGVVFQYAIPQEIDPDSDIDITLQYLSTEANPSSHITKWRVQYLVYGLGEDIPDSMQYGTLVDVDVTPPATLGNTIASLCTIPSAVHSGKHIFGVKINRLGALAGDTHTGDIRLIAFIIPVVTKQLGYEA